MSSSNDFNLHDSQSPRVSVGMPVYNGEATLTRAIEGIRAQTFTDWELILCDDGSSDDSPIIVRQAADEDARIRIIDPSGPRGAPYNFDRVLRSARGEFFMWAAQDDYHRPEFIEANLRELEADPRAVGSVSRIECEPACHPYRKQGTQPLLHSARENRRLFLRNPHMNSRHYALFRREVLLESMRPDCFWAYDWLLILRVLGHGVIREVPHELLVRSTRGESTRWIEALPRYTQRRIERFIPLLALTRRVLNDDELRSDGLFRWILYWQNLKVTAYLFMCFLRSPGSVLRSLWRMPDESHRSTM